MPRPDIERIIHYAAQVVACNEVLCLPMPDWKMKRRATLLTLAKQDIPALLAYIAELEYDAALAGREDGAACRRIRAATVRGSMLLR